MTPTTLAVFLAGLGVIVVAAFYVAAPLFRPTARAAPPLEHGERERWEQRKRQALAAIREAELDHRMGKLSDEDLAAMRARFEAEALGAMAALDAARGGRRS